MIASLAFSALNSSWGRYVVIGLGIVSAVLGFRFKWKRDARKKLEQVREIKVQERGRDALQEFHDERARSVRDGVDASINRLRGRDRRWRGL